MSDNPADQRPAAEQRARVLIDSQLVAAGWSVQDRRELNLFAALGVAVREVVMFPSSGNSKLRKFIRNDPRQRRTPGLLCSTGGIIAGVHVVILERSLFIALSATES